jgi:hypothetical protein
MAENSKTSIRKRLDKGFRKAFPGMRVFVKRSRYAQWSVYIWEHGQARDATGHFVESFSWNADHLLEDAIEWLKQPIPEDLQIRQFPI